MRPKLLKIPGGPLLLTGGRLCPELDPGQSCLPTAGGSSGMFLWVNQDGQADAAGNRNGSEWVMYCVTAEHNARQLRQLGSAPHSVRQRVLQAARSSDTA